MCTYHQPQQIKKQKPIRSLGSVFGPRPFNVLGFDNARMALVYILFVGTPDSHFTSIFPKKIKEEKKRYTVLEKPSLGDLRQSLD